MKKILLLGSLALCMALASCSKDEMHGTLTIRYGDPAETGKWKPAELLLYSLENRAKVLNQIKTENYKSVHLKLEEGGYLLKTSDGKLEHMFHLSAGKNIKVYYQPNFLGKDDKKTQ